MTRESRVGTVVASSFLCLLGIVVAAKWQGHAATPPPVPAPGTSTTNLTLDDYEKFVAQFDDQEPSPRQVAQLGTVGTSEQQETEQKEPPPPPAKKTAPEPAAINEAGLPNLPKLPQTPEAEADAKFNEQLRKAKEPSPALPLQPAEQKVEGPPPAPAPLKPVAPVVEPAAPAFPVATERKNESPAPPLPMAPLTENRGSITPPPPRPGEQPVPPIAERKESAAPALEPAAPAPKEVPPPRPIEAAPKVPDLAPPVKAEPPPITTPAPPARPMETPPVQEITPPIGLSMNQLPSTPPVKTVQPAGGTGGLPEVRTTTTQIREDFAQPGDTSFAALSQRLYGTDRYAAALQAFHRNHFQADPAVKADPPQLRAGTRIFVPPPDVLEKNYPEFLRNSAGNVPPVRISTPMPLPGPGANPNTAAVRLSAPPTADATKRYRVPAQGQMILEIARQTLNDGNRWPEIYRLNPNLQPQYPVPGGTELRLPAAANVP